MVRITIVAATLLILLTSMQSETLKMFAIPWKRRLQKDMVKHFFAKQCLSTGISILYSISILPTHYKLFEHFIIADEPFSHFDYSVLIVMTTGKICVLKQQRKN